MKIVSVNVALPADVRHGERTTRTGIFKQPVAGPVRVGTCNLDGDGQADLVHHGGEHKAVYAYAFDHYAYWRELLGRGELPCGQFGENLTVAGLDENELCVGDELQAGSAAFVITQPRVPCFKLGIRFADERMPRLFAESGRTGFYLRVLREGVIRAGDALEVVGRGRGRIAIGPLFAAYRRPRDPDAAALLRRALDVPELSPEWRAHIRERLA